MEKSFEPITFNKRYEPFLIEFLEKCLPESGRALDINGRHSFYKNIENCFKAFWCMFDHGKVIGVVEVKELDNKSCELKSLYLLEQYHGMGMESVCYEKLSIMQKKMDMSCSNKR